MLNHQKTKHIGKIPKDDFICIKVPRDEIPDVDRVKMTIVERDYLGYGVLKVREDQLKS